MNYSYSNTKMNQDQVTRINLSFESQNKHGNNERFLVSGSLLAKISILLCLLTSMFTMFANKISFLLWSLSSIHRGIVKMSTVNFDFIGELIELCSVWYMLTLWRISTKWMFAKCVRSIGAMANDNIYRLRTPSYNEI